MTRELWFLLALFGFLVGAKPPAGRQELPKTGEALPLPQAQAVAPGSLYAPDARYADLGRDFRARLTGDVVTIVVADRVSATAKGGTKSGRSSELGASIPALAGPKKAATFWSDLARLQGNQKLQGEGETSRNSEFTTTVSARVMEVLGNGDLVVAGTREVWINSERQTVLVQGIARWNDLNRNNQIRSDQLADLKVRIDGKGVVQDAIRRPNFLYRLLMGILPF